MNERPLRSVLFLPADNARAVAKARTLFCDAVVLDLEDAVAPEAKAAARAAAVAALGEGDWGERLTAVRVNGLDTAWGGGDLAALADAAPDVVIAPKIDVAPRVIDYASMLPARARLWAMVETCGAVMNLSDIARASPALSGLMIGTNDLSKDMRRPLSRDRRPLHAALALTVTAARANGLVALDGVFNALDDAEGFAAEAAEGRGFGFDGKSLIHPSQIEAANRAFSPGEDELAWAKGVVDAFADQPDAALVRANGAMVERLHLEQAQRLLRLAQGLSAAEGVGA